MRLPRLTLGIIRDIRDKTGVDILRIAEPQVSARIQSDMVWLAQAIAVAGGPADLSGDDLGDAVDAFMDRIVESFPRGSVLDSDRPKADPAQHNPWHAVFRMAGVCGLDPYPLTMRELFWAAEGAWEPHAVAIANFIGAHAGKGQRPPKPADINPYARTGRTITRRKTQSQKDCSE